MLIHASDIKSWTRCPQQWHLLRTHPGKQLSRTAYGSVIHHALHVMERTGDPHRAIETFKHYWHPHHIEAVCEPVQIWCANDTYGKLALRGVETLKRYADLLTYDESELLALEYEFVVPLHGTVDRETGRPHLLAGTVDRLAIRRYHRQPTVCLDDFKSGKRQTYLRHNVQGTAYAYASEQPEFWTGWPEQHTDGFENGGDLYARYTTAARRFWWVDVSSSIKWVDGGFRGPKDYDRLRLAVQSVCDSIQADIFPLSLDGEVCQYCPVRDHCAGLGLDDAEGAVA